MSAQPAATESTPGEIAAKLSSILEQGIGAKEFAEVLALNAADPDPDVCHSHDYCDANVIMDEAFPFVLKRSATDSGGSGIGLMSDADAEIWNSAWATFRRKIR